jgi:hypothetical protein
MAYGNDVTVFVEDKSGDLGAPGGNPFWISPDVDIPAHSGQAVQGANTIRVRVHSHEEPILEEKFIAEVYVGNPSLVMSPVSGTIRIDPGNLRFRPPGVAGSEPVATQAGGTTSFSWTPTSSPANIDGPGHRCLVVRAFPETVTPPSSPFDIANEQHEAMHNMEILTTTTAPGEGAGGGDAGKDGAGTPKDPRRHDERTGMWWQLLDTLAAGKRGKRYVAVAFDPKPDRQLVAGLRKAFGRINFNGFSSDPPAAVAIDALGTPGGPIEVPALPKGRGFAGKSGLGTGLFTRERMLAAARVELGPRKVSKLAVGFDHSHLGASQAVMLHVVQWGQDGTPEGGFTIVALAPR